jgi:predicted dehydrogenase
MDGGMLYTQFSHFIDLLLWLLGDMESVSGICTNNGLRQNFEIDDTCVAALRMQNGAVGTLNFSINTFGGNKEGSLTLIGEKGTAKIGGQYLNTLEWMESETGTVVRKTAANAADNPGVYTASMSHHQAVYDELVKALAGQPHLLPNTEEAVKTVITIEKIYAACNFTGKQ